MRQEPVVAILNLWSLGHSASDIAEKLGTVTAKRVTLIVGEARSIGDPRAVLHMAKNGRLLGRPGRMAHPPKAERVPSVRALACRVGHRQIRKNLDTRGYCRLCQRIVNRNLRRRQRAKA